MPDSVIQRSFCGGELAPALHARADTVKYTQALKTCRNFVVRREGGVSNRAGFGLVDACKDDAANKRLMRFVTQAAGVGLLIEIGQGYFRFFKNGAAIQVAGVAAWSAVTSYVPGDLVVEAGVTYYCHTASLNDVPPDTGFWHPLTGAILEIPTPYVATDRFQWNQTGNVITITHPTYPPRELIYVSDTTWVLQTVSTLPTIPAPTNGAGVAGAVGTRTFKYLITAAADDTYEESLPSSVITIAAAAAPTELAPHALTWDAQPDAVEFYVYLDPYENGVFGFIGTAAANAFKDVGFVPDFGVTPPISRVLFGTPNNYPTTSAHFQQRRFFGNTNLEPDSVWGSRIGFPSNFGITSPLQDDDAVTFRVEGNNNNPVRHLVALKSGLALLTDGGEWIATGGGGAKQPITPNSIDAEQETYAGVAKDIKPVIIGNTLLYLQARGSVVRELKFAQEVEGLAGRDLTIYAAHLFTRKTIVAMDVQQIPDSIIWCVRSDGVLLGLTYIPEQDIWGWHRHDTYTNLPGATVGVQSLIEDVCVVPEADEDVVYVIVARAIGGATKRFIERLERRDARDGFFGADSFFVDSGMSYAGAPTSAVTGLDHLDGQVVAVLADGVTVFNGDPLAANAADFTVVAGQIDLPTPASNVHVGLPIRFAEIETLDLDAQGSAIRDAKKRVPAVTVLVERSARSFWAGPDTASLRQHTSDTWESTALSETGPYEVHITSEFTRAGRVVVRQIDPLPLTILGVIPNVEIGG